ncbi:septal ring lytic transglycosylase RlpA family protein, partial [Thiomonas sp.]|uniref:septal ring lytic transglycosylase RlpA family protein n=1 Tax=Thiomonas sp. TaxID=2047785 RepID=UPI00262D3B84
VAAWPPAWAASSPSRRSGVAMQAPVNASSGCYAPAPNPRAAYNRDYTVLGHTYAPLRNASGYDVDGTASWYGWESGKTTSMGTYFNPRAFTAASRVLPLPTCVEVTNLRNGRSALVLVNDRGPFVDSRVMDLSYGAAKALGVTGSGTAPVRIVALAPGTMQSSPAQGSAPPAPAQAAPLLGPQGAPETFAPAPLAPAAQPGSPSAVPEASQPMQVATLQPLDAQASQAPRTTASGSGQVPSTGAAGAASDPLGALIASAAASSASAREGASGPAPAAYAASAPTASPPPPLQTASAAAPAVQPAPTVQSAPPLQASPNQAQVPAPAQAQAPMPAGEPQTYVQTGAFTVEGNARQEARRIERAGLGPVEVVPGFVHGRTWYKVQIGPLPRGAQDPALRDSLARLGMRDYTYVQQ